MIKSVAKVVTIALTDSKTNPKDQPSQIKNNKKKSVIIDEGEDYTFVVVFFRESKCSKRRAAVPGRYRSRYPPTPSGL